MDISDFRTVPINFFIDIVLNKLEMLGFKNHVDECNEENKCKECKESHVCLFYLSVIEEITRAYAEEMNNEHYIFNDWLDNTIQIYNNGILIEPSRVKVNLITTNIDNVYNPKEFII